MISLSGGKVLLHYPEERIREYCDLEVYHGYDDLYSIDNAITTQDIEALSFCCWTETSFHRAHF